WSRNWRSRTWWTKRTRRSAARPDARASSPMPGVSVATSTARGSRSAVSWAARSRPWPGGRSRAPMPGPGPAPRPPAGRDGATSSAFWLHEYVEKDSFNPPYTFVAAQTGLDEKTVRDIFNARAEFLGRWHRFETPRILGIDELYLNKRYRCILTNIEERTLLDLLATRRQDVVTNYLMKLKDRQKVEIVSMDMWNPYRAAVKAVLPQARIVVDKFHVVRMANDALERVRKGLRKELKPSQSRT